MGTCIRGEGTVSWENDFPDRTNSKETSGGVEGVMGVTRSEGEKALRARRRTRTVF